MMLATTDAERSPVQGQDPERKHQQLQRLGCSPSFTSSTQSSTPATPDSTAEPYQATSSPAGRRLDPRFNVNEADAPLRRSHIHQSAGLPDSLGQSPKDYTTGPRYRWSNMSFTGDRKDGAATINSRNRVPAWLQRAGAAGQAYSEQSIVSPDATSAQSNTRTSSQSSSKTISPTGNSRFAFFTSSMSALKGMAATPVSVPQDDELMNIDVDQALFPAGPPDSFSPAAFKNLQMNATGLLQKFQTAYQQRAIAYQELKADCSAVGDEKYEVETRVQHLKMQLEDMARKASEQEAMMQSLMEELNLEKKLRADERRARDPGMLASDASTISEDLGAEEDQKRRQRRKSGYTAKSESDMSFDTDEESVEASSVFSRSRSPTIATTITDISPVESMSISLNSPPQLQPQAQLQQLRTPNLVQPRTPRPVATSQPQPQMNTFQKLFKGISGDAGKDGELRGTSSCRNCEGQDASVAWDTVNLLKDENKGLKERVGELEAAVEGALDVVNGIGL